MNEDSPGRTGHERTWGGLCLLGLLGTVLLTLALAAAGPIATGDATAIALRPTRTTVACLPDSLSVGASTLCTAKVADTGSGKKLTPTGTVGFTSSGSGSFDNTSCTLEGTATTVSCEATYTPEAAGNGTHVISASYGGSETHAASSGRAELSIVPPNDALRAAQKLRQPPTSAGGTTVGATTNFSDPEPRCAAVEGNVWYAFSARRTQRIAVRLRAHGQLDAVVAAFQRVRSQFKLLGCARTDAKGIGGVAFQAQKRGRYLILVGERENSASSTFRLELFAPPLANPPGAHLPPDGARALVDPLTKPEAAWSVALAAGTTYRINLAADRDRCLSLSLFAPGTGSFANSEPLRYTGCGGYFEFTPGPDGGGRYSLLVGAEGNREGGQRYRLQVARAGVDDKAPGLLISSGEIRRGSLDGGSIDVIDLYRFEVSHRTETSARLSTSKGARFDLLLLSSTGEPIRCECGRTQAGNLRARLDAGEYFLAVRARGQSQGRYRVSLLIREITKTTVLVAGSLNATSARGQVIPLDAQVTPSAAVGGRVRFEVDHFDPIEGWQFYRLFGARVSSSGVASVSWRPPSVGRWRVHAVFLGTRAASPSESRHVLLVVEPTT